MDELISWVQDTAATDHVSYGRACILGRDDVADLALGNLRDYTPAIRELSQMLAWASALDLPPERWRASDAMDGVVRELFESWSSDVPLEREGRS